MSNFLKTNLCLILFLGFIFVLTLFPPFDPDFGWQLRCGQLVLKGKNCLVNNFTTLLEGFKWAYPTFVYPLILSLTFNNFSFWGISLLNATVVTLIYLLMFKTLKGDQFIKIGLLTLSIFLSWIVLYLGLRSQIFSLLFFSITLFIIDRVRNKNFKLLYLTPLVFLVWANTHAGFIPGLMLLAFYNLELVFKKNWEKSLKAFGALTASVLATLITPYGIEIYNLLFEHFRTPLNTLIAEWVSPTPVHWAIMLTAAGWLVFWSFKNKKIDLFLMLGLIFFVYLGLSARRNLAFSYLFLFYALSFSLRDVYLEKLNNSKILVVTFLLSGIGLILLTVVPNTHVINTDWEEFCIQSPVGYPCNAVEFLRKQPKKGNLFNPYEQGGFLIWQLPEYKIFVDGRMPAWKHPSDKSPYTIYLEIVQAQPGWEETIKQNKTDWMLVGNGTFIDIELQERPREWLKERYRDERYVVYEVI